MALPAQTGLVPTRAGIVATRNGPLSDHERLQTFVQQASLDRRGKPAWIVVPQGPTIQFWVNPQTYRETSEVLHVDMPTVDGFVRTSFGARPRVFNLEGTTGTAGWDAGDHGGMADLDRLKPTNNRPDALVTFYFPYMFGGNRGHTCYINRFVQETRPDAPLYYYYQIELVAYPPQIATPCFTPVAEATILPLTNASTPTPSTAQPPPNIRPAGTGNKFTY